MKKWTVGFVNWKSIDYLFYQFKTLYEFNDNFDLIVMDNTYPNQTEELEKIQKEFPFTLLSFDNSYWQTHGNGLNKIMNSASSEFILFQDPDFFWTIKNHLCFLESFLIAGSHAVGGSFLQNDFPAVYGSAFRLNEIKDLDLDSCWKDCPNCNHGFLIDKHMDTGWQLRIRFKNQKYTSFRFIEYQGPNLGLHSYTLTGTTFLHENQIIAHHLCRGEYPSENIEDTVPNEWKKNRKSYSQYFYEICKTS